MSLTHRRRVGQVNCKFGFSNLCHCPGPDPHLLSPLTKRTRLLCLLDSCNTRNHSSVSNPPSILQWLAAINTLQVGSCHDALALKEADSITAGQHRPPAQAGATSVKTQAGKKLQESSRCRCPLWTACCRAACLVKARQKPLPATCLPPYGGHLKTVTFTKKASNYSLIRCSFDWPNCLSAVT